MSNEIDDSSLNDWKHHPITKELFRYMKDLDKLAEATILNPQIVFMDKALCTIAANQGVREIIDRILNISVDDLLKEEENNDGEMSQSSWG